MSRVFPESVQARSDDPDAICDCEPASRDKLARTAQPCSKLLDSGSSALVKSGRCGQPLPRRSQHVPGSAWICSAQNCEQIEGGNAQRGNLFGAARRCRGAGGNLRALHPAPRGVIWRTHRLRGWTRVDPKDDRTHALGAADSGGFLGRCWAFRSPPLKAFQPVSAESLIPPVCG
jgi:hypothetical protein